MGHHLASELQNYHLADSDQVAKPLPSLPETWISTGWPGGPSDRPRGLLIIFEPHPHHDTVGQKVRRASLWGSRSREGWGAVLSHSWAPWPEMRCSRSLSDLYAKGEQDRRGSLISPIPGGINRCRRTHFGGDTTTAGCQILIITVPREIVGFGCFRESRIICGHADRKSVHPKFI